jgi:hypothetical protein
MNENKYVFINSPQIPVIPVDKSNKLQKKYIYKSEKTRFCLKFFYTKQ